MMTIRNFLGKYKDALNTTYSTLYYFIRKYQRTLQEIGAVEVVKKLEREYIIVQDEKKLLDFIREKQPKSKAVAV